MNFWKYTVRMYKNVHFLYIHDTESPVYGTDIEYRNYKGYHEINILPLYNLCRLENNIFVINIQMLNCRTTIREHFIVLYRPHKKKRSFLQYLRRLKNQCGRTGFNFNLFF